MNPFPIVDSFFSEIALMVAFVCGGVFLWEWLIGYLKAAAEAA